MRTLGLCLLAFVMSASTGCQGVKGSGTPRTEGRQVAAFSALEAGGAYRLDVKQGLTTSLELEGDDNLLPLVETTVKDGRLLIRSRETLRPTSDIAVRITTPRVESVSLAGSSELHLSGIDGPALRLQISGSGEAWVKGRADQLDLTVTGAGEVHASHLLARKVAVRVTGAGEAEVHASASLEVQITGAATVGYYGDPKDVRQQITGAGRLTKR